MKTCTKCKNSKPADGFPRSSRTKDGRNPHCKSCISAYNRSYRYSNHERVKAAQRIRDKRHSYGLEPHDLDAMRIAQDHRCALCGTPEDQLRTGLHVDHDHAKTGRAAVRALLCGQCNRALGLFHDNPQLLRIAAAYLEYHHAR